MFERIEVKHNWTIFLNDSIAFARGTTDVSVSFISFLVTAMDSQINKRSVDLQQMCIFAPFTTGVFVVFLFEVLMNSNNKGSVEIDNAFTWFAQVQTVFITSSICWHWQFRNDQTMRFIWFDYSSSLTCGQWDGSNAKSTSSHALILFAAY